MDEMSRQKRVETRAVYDGGGREGGFWKRRGTSHSVIRDFPSSRRVPGTMVSEARIMGNYTSLRCSCVAESKLEG